MAALRLQDLKTGQIYLEPLSGYKVRVRSVEISAVGTPNKAMCYYWNAVTGHFVEFEVLDYELEEVTAVAPIQ